MFTVQRICGIKKAPGILLGNPKNWWCFQGLELGPLNFELASSCFIQKLRTLV